MKLAIVSPGFPNSRGGVTDHTSRLRRHWREEGYETCVQDSVTDRAQDVAIHWHQSGVGAVLIQYVPFLYGRRGISTFPLGIARAARAVNLRVIVFVHEPWVPRTRLQWLVLSPLQRHQLRRLLRECHAYATAVPSWLSLLGPHGHLIYVGSTLGDEPLAELAVAPLPAPSVFSPYASGLRWEWIVAAARAIGTQPELTIIGGDWDTARRHPNLGRWARRTWDWRGHPDAAGVRSLLGRSRLVLAPFVDGLTARRTSPCAALSMGARVISCRGPLFDQTFEAGPVILADWLEQFVERAREMWTTDDSMDIRRQRLEWYHNCLEPRVWDSRLLSLLCDGERV